MLSIIVPTFNEEKYLPLLLDSIKNQDFKGYEIIVADNNSIDKTIEIAKNYGCKITEGGLPGAGRNKGSEIAQGDLLLFLDADVILPAGFLNEFIKKLEESGTGIASADLAVMENKKVYNIGVNFFNFFYRNTEKFLPSATECILIKKDIDRKINGFDETIMVGEDLDYVRRAAKFGKFRHFSSIKFYASCRRFEKYGIIKTMLQYFAAGFHQIFYPVKSSILKYNFGYSENGNNKSKKIRG